MNKIKQSLKRMRLFIIEYYANVEGFKFLSNHFQGNV